MKFYTLVFALLILGASLAVKPILVGTMSAIVHIHGVASTTQRIYLPQITDMQAATYPYSPEEDGYGNKYIVVKGEFDVQVRTHIDSNRLLILSDDPISARYENLSEYLEPTSLVNSDSPLIKSLASSLVKGSKTRLEEISKLAMWTNRHITYDSKYSGVYLSGVETLKIGKGVCDEYTNLYTSLARASGIPTRIVIGLVYSGSDWRLHAWAESYAGGTWIPVDPTFGELGQIDATHIVLYRGPRYPFYVSPENVLNYDVDSPEFGNFSLPIEVGLNETKIKVSPRQIFNISLMVENKGNTILTPTYLLQTTQGIQTISPHRQTIILHPHERKVVSWRLVAPYGEKPEYFLELVGPGIDQLMSLTVSRVGVNLTKKIDISEVFAYSQGDNITLLVTIRNTGNMDLDSVPVVAVLPGYGSKQKQASIPVGSSKRIKFEFPLLKNIGEIYVSASIDNKTISAYVPVFMSEKKEDENQIETVFNILSKNILKFFWVTIALVLFVSFLVVLSIHPPRKEPFRERHKWSKLLKMDKSKKDTARR